VYIWEKREIHTDLGGGSLKEPDHLEDPDIDSRILKGILILRLKGIDWILMAQERDKWWAVRNMVINLQVPQNVGNFMTSC
jgi:hypothetical protein